MQICSLEHGSLHLGVKCIATPMLPYIERTVRGRLAFFASMSDRAGDPVLQLLSPQHAERLYVSSQELSVKRVEGRDVTVLKTSHDKRLGVCASLLGSKSSLACYISAILMRVPVTECASERNWSRWGLVFTP